MIASRVMQCRVKEEVKVRRQEIVAIYVDCKGYKDKGVSVEL